MKTVKQIADELGVSKQAVHQKRKKKRANLPSWNQVKINQESGKYGKNIQPRQFEIQISNLQVAISLFKKPYLKLPYMKSQRRKVF